MNQLVRASRAAAPNLPALVATSGEQAARRFLEFFASNIRNRNTRIAYSHSVELFLTWCEEYGVPSLGDVQPLHVAAWLEMQALTASAPTVEQRLAAIASIRLAGDWPNRTGKSCLLGARPETHCAQRQDTSIGAG